MEIKNFINKVLKYISDYRITRVFKSNNIQFIPELELDDKNIIIEFDKVIVVNELYDIKISVFAINNVFENESEYQLFYTIKDDKYILFKSTSDDFIFDIKPSNNKSKWIYIDGKLTQIINDLEWIRIYDNN